MASEIKMPQLGLTMTEGTVTRWFKTVGEAVAQGEVLFEVATDKITNQIESTTTGTILEIRVPEGQVAPVQAVLGMVGEAGEVLIVDGTSAPAVNVGLAVPAAAPVVEKASEAKTEPSGAPVAPTQVSASEIKMPQLGLTMTEGTVTRWFKAVGDTVTHGEVLFEVATDKITNQVESTATGTILEIKVHEGQVAPVQALLGLVGEMGAVGAVATVPAAIVTEKSAPVVAATVPVATAVVATGVPATIGSDGWVKASPSARKRAQEMNIDLAKVTATGPEGRVVEADVLGFGWVKASPAARKAAKDRKIELAEVVPTGPEGRVVERDVLAYSENKARTSKTSPLAAKMAPELGVDLSAIDKDGRIMKADILAAAKIPAVTVPAAASVPALPKTKPLVGMRKVIAERMQQSWNVAPHVHLTVEIDMTNALALKEQLAKASGEKASVTEIIIKCAAQVLTEMPVVNANIVGKQIVFHDSAAVGVAVSLDDGLIVPVIREAEKKSLREIRAAVVDLGSRARSGRLLPDEISGGTFTVTNLGMFGTDHFTPIINPPESAILAVCRTVDKPVVMNGQIVVRPMCNCVLGFDHRLVDGAVGAKYMARFRELMENPLLLLIG